MNSVKSKFPDLIFPEWRAQRSERLIRHYRANKNWDLSDLQLDRATVFITHRCNLVCRYCNGPHLNPKFTAAQRRVWLAKEFTRATFAQVLEQFHSFGLKYIHFTGGEATLNPFLADFIESASNAGMLCALTTNGTAKPGLFRKLINCGLYEIRISIDSFVAQKYDTIVGVRGAFRRLEANLEEIVRLRDQENFKVYLILNATVGSFNFSELQDTIDKLIRLKPDDIKLLIVGEEEDFVHQSVSSEQMHEMETWLKEKNLGYELLPLKIKGFYNSRSFGLKDAHTRANMKYCFVPLTERTLDAEHVYPCSIYLRYFGSPISSVKKSIAQQQEEIIRFVTEHRCLEDEICFNYCTRCTREFNVEVNRLFRDCQIEDRNKLGSQQLKLHYD